MKKVGLSSFLCQNDHNDISDTLAILLLCNSNHTDRNNNYAAKIGKMLFFLYNTFQISLETTVIVLVAKTYIAQRKGKVSANKLSC